jgi:hypothetical protein
MWQQGPAEKTEDPLLVTFSLYKINDQKQREGNSEVRGFEKENKPAFFTHKKTKSPKQIHKIDLNRADSVMLLSLKGIGPVFGDFILRSSCLKCMDSIPYACKTFCLTFLLIRKKFRFGI